MVAMKAFSFYGIRSVIITKLENSSRQNRTIKEYQIDKGSDGKFILINTFRNLFPRATVKQLAKHKDKGSFCKCSKKTRIPHVGVCSIKIKHKNKQRLCKLFVIPRNGHLIKDARC